MNKYLNGKFEVYRFFINLHHHPNLLDVIQAIFWSLKTREAFNISRTTGTLLWSKSSITSLSNSTEVFIGMIFYNVDKQSIHFHIVLVINSKFI